MERSDPGSGPRHHHRILVIDDDAGIRLLVRLNIEEQGFDVLLAEDGVTGLSTAQRERPDAIVLDLMMPGMDGFQVLAELRRDRRTQHVPVVILTAVALSASREWALELGADAVVTKPFLPEELLSVVASLVAAGRSASPGRMSPGIEAPSGPSTSRTP